MSYGSIEWMLKPIGDTTPPISVLISVHNGAKTLEKCLKSVCTQTINTISIVFIDDCSTDDTLTVLETIQKTFPHIPFTILKNEQNLGLTKSLNKGLKEIHSPYTARIDADDWWHPKKLELQFAFLTSHPEYGIVGCNYINYSPHSERTVHLPETDALIRARMMKRNPFAHSCVIFRTPLIQELGGYDTTVRYAQDYELWLRSLPHTKFYNVQETLCYRLLGQGISAQKQKQQMRQVLQTQLKYIRKYHLSLFTYIYMTESLINIITPEFIRRIKQRFLG